MIHVLSGGIGALGLRLDALEHAIPPALVAIEEYDEKR
jgi:hypothetical protein